jgi:hypothetical protein
MSEELRYGIGKSGWMFVYPLSKKWNGLIISTMDGAVEEKTMNGIETRGITIPPENVEKAKELIKNINSGKQKYKPKEGLGAILIDGGENGLTLAEYGNTLAIFGVVWNDDKTKDEIKSKFTPLWKPYIEGPNGKKGAWLVRVKFMDEAIDLVNEYNSKLSDVSSKTPAPAKKKEKVAPAPAPASEKEEEVAKGYQRVNYVLKKPYLGQSVEVIIEGDSEESEVSNIIARSSEPRNVVDLIQLANGSIAAIVAGRWELLYEPRNHSLTFH